MVSLGDVLTRRVQFRTKLTLSMVIDFAGCWIIEKGCKALFADLEPMEMVTRGRERREKRREVEESEKANGLPELNEVVKKTQ
jgi:cation-transporting ATPase 13A1